MKVLIDQSGKIENTNRHTFLAFSNKKNYILKIPARVKRQLQVVFRQQGKSRLFVYKTFAAGIFLLVEKFIKKEINLIVIDKEYPGKESLIKQLILELTRRKKTQEPEIRFERLGKHSKPHFLAYGAAIKKQRVNKVVSFEEIKRLVIKNDRGHKSD